MSQLSELLKGGDIGLVCNGQTNNHKVEICFKDTASAAALSQYLLSMRYAKKDDPLREHFDNVEGRV